MSEKLLKVVVERSKWYRGKTDEHSRLLLSDGTMCCLGFACKAARLKDEQISEVAFPCMLTAGGLYDLGRDFKLPVVLNKLVDGIHNSNICSEIGRTNDNPSISDQVRESTLIRLGKQAGIAFTFVD